MSTERYLGTHMDINPSCISQTSISVYVRQKCLRTLSFEERALLCRSKPTSILANVTSYESVVHQILLAYGPYEATHIYVGYILEESCVPAGLACGHLGTAMQDF